MKTTTSIDSTPLAVRIERLERQCRRLRSWATIVLGLLAAWVGLAAARQEVERPVHEARAFRLIDENDQVRGEWKLTDEGDPSFVLLDGNGYKRYEALLKGETVFVRMRDRNDRSRITQIVDDNDHPHILLTDVTQKLRMQMAIAASGAPSLVFFDAGGEAPAGIGIHPDGRPWLRSGEDEER
jgi:hypothetical protein